MVFPPNFSPQAFLSLYLGCTDYFWLILHSVQSGICCLNSFKYKAGDHGTGWLVFTEIYAAELSQTGCEKGAGVWGLQDQRLLSHTCFSFSSVRQFSSIMNSLSVGEIWAVGSIILIISSCSRRPISILTFRLRYSIYSTWKRNPQIFNII